MLHAKVLPGNPYDGHTLRTIERTELTGREIERAYVDKEYCGHDAWKTHTRLAILRWFAGLDAIPLDPIIPYPT